MKLPLRFAHNRALYRRMYDEFFGFSRRPFSLTPDPEFLFWTSRHRAAAGLLEAGIRRRSPITVVTGDVGAGKTTLIRHLLDTAPDDLTIGLLSNVIGEQGDLYRWILMAFGEESAPSSKPRQVRAIQDFVIDEYAAGRATALVVDEAQNLSDDGLEGLRLLSNINVGKDMLLSLVMVGQPLLRRRLQQWGHRQFAQRVGATYHLGPMMAEETEAYVRHRLEVAGGSADLFERGAIASIHAAALGVPRIVNSIANLCLVAAFGEGLEKIDTAFARSVIDEAREQGMVAALWQPEAVEALDTGEMTVARAGASRATAPQVVVPFGGPRGAARRSERPLSLRPVPTTLAAPSPVERSAPPDADPVQETPAPAAHDEPHDPVAATPRADAPVEPQERGARRLAGLVDGALTGALVAACAGLILTPLLREVSRVGGERDLPVEVSRAPSRPAGDALPAAVEDPVIPAVAPAPLSPRDIASLASSRFIDALNISLESPVEGAIRYARSALLGHERAAYYLGQMYETGDGVAMDFALARGWYDEAGALGEPLLAALPEPQPGRITAPRPLASTLTENGYLELVWTSGRGADPSAYLVEFAGEGSAAIYAEETTLSALRLAPPAGASSWRVIARGPNGEERATDWQPLRP
ncbi:ExeA family protein [Roseitranquillus sediminis]|uniref:ExeA family protein n=1 Tax=Roseitranquillus sediminis TaxID=2809051 RepID=UPI001D0CB5AA|nr:AAA family ATPase [Roseitranquillus sediminis]MBM9594863.1 AAA family ATPase [Roseitranquillus sediminis]